MIIWFYYWPISAGVIFFLGLTFKAPGLLLWLASCRQTSEEKANGFDTLKGGGNKFSSEFDCMWVPRGERKTNVSNLVYSDTWRWEGWGASWVSWQALNLEPLLLFRYAYSLTVAKFARVLRLRAAGDECTKKDGYQKRTEVLWECSQVIKCMSHDQHLKG